jgi:hypothetical protein
MKIRAHFLCQKSKNFQRPDGTPLEVEFSQESAKAQKCA